MSRVIVNIMSEQTIPNYLFIREMYCPGDKLLFIISQNDRFIQNTQRILDTLDWNITPIKVILNNKGDEEDWSSMTNIISSYITKDEEYLVNLTGGTKFMALAVQTIFSGYNSKFFYIPFPKNIILGLAPNSEKKDIAWRVEVKEYLSLYGIKTKEKTIIKSEEYTNYFFTLFMNVFSNIEWQILDKLREYRNNKKGIDILSVESQPDSKKFPQITGLQNFINSCQFQLAEASRLKKHEIQYLTGGWFEEYTYNLIKNKLKPNDLRLGVEIVRTESTNQNDLDVVFTKGNKLYVVECKTGVGRESLFKEIVYKASALKETLLGLSANSYIFSLSPENEALNKTAQNMMLKYCDKTYFADTSKTETLLNSIKDFAND